MGILEFKKKKKGPIEGDTEYKGHSDSVEEVGHHLSVLSHCGT